MTQPYGDADRALSLSEFTTEERDALLMADDLRDRLQRERDAAGRLRDFLYGTGKDHPEAG
jgi:hypothetical protein